MTEAELPDVWVDVPNMLRTGLVRAYSIQTQNDTRYIPATRIDALEAELAAERERRVAAEAVLRELENDDGVGDLIDTHFARYKD